MRFVLVKRRDPERERHRPLLPGEQPDGSWILDTDLEWFPNARGPEETGEDEEGLAKAGWQLGFDFDETRHPRQPTGTRGRYRGGEFAPKAAAAAAGPPPPSAPPEPTREQLIAAWEREHWDKPIEHALIVNADGSETRNLVGTKRMIRVPPELIESGWMRGATFTHNHPVFDLISKPQDQAAYNAAIAGADAETIRRVNAEFRATRKVAPSFSPEDISLACCSGVAEIRAVAGGRVYWMRPPPDGWDISTWLFKIEPAMKKAVTKFKRYINKEMREGRMSRADAEELAWDTVWKEVAKKTGVRYGEDPLGEVGMRKAQGEGEREHTLKRGGSRRSGHLNPGRYYARCMHTGSKLGRCTVVRNVIRFDSPIPPLTATSMRKGILDSDAGQAHWIEPSGKAHKIGKVVHGDYVQRHFPDLFRQHVPRPVSTAQNKEDDENGAQFSNSSGWVRERTWQHGTRMFHSYTLPDKPGKRAFEAAELFHMQNHPNSAGDVSLKVGRDSSDWHRLKAGTFDWHKNYARAHSASLTKAYITHEELRALAAQAREEPEEEDDGALLPGEQPDGTWILDMEGSWPLAKSRQVFDPAKHPRQAKGQIELPYRPGEFIPASFTGESGALARAVARAEREIVALNYERAYVFNPDGTVRLAKNGTKDQVTFEHSEYSRMGGCTFTHNHPNSSFFSTADVAFACNNRLAEMRVVSMERTCSMKPPPGGWNRTFYKKKVRPAILRHEATMRKRLHEREGEGLSTGDEAWNHLRGLLWSRVARDTGMRYREQVSDYGKRMARMWEVGRRELSREMFQGEMHVAADRRRLAKAIPLGPGERWITVHPNGEEEEGRPVLIKENPDGSHTIIGGAGGKLTGLRLTAVDTPEGYRRRAAEKAREKREKRAGEEAKAREELGEEEYRQRAAERQVHAEKLVEAKEAQEKNFIQTVAVQQGWDPTALEVPDEELHGHSARLQEKIRKLHHQRLLRVAHSVADRSREIVKSAHDEQAQEALGDVSLSDLDPPRAPANQVGYQADFAQKAADHALEAGRGASAQAAHVRQQQADISWRGFLERRGGDLDAAMKAAAATARLHQAAAVAREELKEADERQPYKSRLAELEVVPQVETMADAAGILAAQTRARAAAKETKAALADLHGDVAFERIPAAAPMVAGAITDEAALRKVEDDLAEEERQGAARNLVDFANTLETDTGSLRSQISVGHAAVFSQAASQLGMRPIDPIIADVLGPRGMAEVLAHNLRKEFDPQHYEEIKGAIAAEHVASQVRISNEAVAEGHRLQDEAEAIQLPVVNTAEDLIAAQHLNATKTELIGQARAQAGMARGRLEAAASLNEALERSQAGEITVSLGPMSSKDAVAHTEALGLTEPSAYDDAGELIRERDYTLHTDGMNRILVVHRDGIEKLSQAIEYDPGQAHRINTMRNIRQGGQDEEGWFPTGFSRRPKTDFSVDGIAQVPVDTAFHASGASSPGALKAALQDHIGRRALAGQSQEDILSAVRSYDFANEHGLTDSKAFQAALDEVAPLPSPQAIKDSRSGHPDALNEHMDALRDTFQGYAGKGEGGRKQQLIADDPVTRDLAFQIVARDPRLQQAFVPVGNLDRDARKAVRSWAFQHLLHVNPKDTSILTPLTPIQHEGYNLWARDIERHGADDPYPVVQSHLQKQSEAEASEGGGMFGPEEGAADPLTRLDLSNDTAVVDYARKHAKALGLETERQVTDLASGKFTDVPIMLDIGRELENGRIVDDDAAVRHARYQVRKQLRQRYWESVGRPELGEWNPSYVERGTDRWDHFVRDMGGEEEAYRTAQELMQGQVAGQFAAAHKSRTGRELTVYDQPVTHAEQLRGATRGALERMKLRAARASATAGARRREAGRYATEREGGVAATLAAQRAAESAGALLGREVGTPENLPDSRSSLGESADNALARLLPALNLRNASRPMQALNYSDAKGVRRQRIIKAALSMKRMAIAAGVGSGKTAIAIGTFTTARANGDAHRAMFAVPSVVQGQFGGEMNAFLDPSSGVTYHANPGESKEERREAYADPGTHMMVVTHQGLRDDLRYAVAQHQFGGSEKKADEFMRTAGAADRAKALSDAVGALGWHFDFAALDEAHDALDRKGKPDSLLSRYLDAFTASKNHYLSMSADPVKNDASEAWSLLNKLAPDRYPEGSQEKWLRKYGRQTPAMVASMKREMAPYVYPERVESGVERHTHVEPLNLHPAQQQDYDRIMGVYRKLRQMRLRGKTPNPADFLQMDPAAFDGCTTPAEKQKRAGELMASLGMVRDAALTRVVNAHPEGVKLDQVEHILSGAHAANRKDKPTLIFSHLRDSVKQIASRLKEKGYHVSVMTGEHTAKQKAEIRMAFQKDDAPPGRVMVLSDAGCVGQNLQKANTVINFDVPYTAKTLQQRNGRADRVGQKEDVHVFDLVTDTGLERLARQRLSRKDAMRDELTSASELTDDTNIAHAIAQVEERRFQRDVQRGGPQAAAPEAEERKAA